MGLELTTSGKNYFACEGEAKSLAARYFNVPVENITLNFEHAEVRSFEFSVDGTIRYVDFSTRFAAYVQDSKEEQ